jgi:hypothetical protein
MLMSSKDHYRLKAAEIRRQARAEMNVSTRFELALLALSYERLAEQAERNARNNVTYEYDPDATAERRQLAQAQQQQQQQHERPKRP